MIGGFQHPEAPWLPASLTEQSCIVFDGASNKRRHGVSICFADPRKNAIEAHVFWCPEKYAQTVSARINSTLAYKLGSRISLGDIRCEKVLLKTVNGVQHIMLRTPKVLSQVQCFGEDIRVQPFYIEIITRFFPDIEPSQQAIQHLANIYRDRKLTDNIDSWTVEAKRHRDALIAIDLVHRGYPYQVVARVIHGDKFVEEEWNNPNRTLKNRTIRSFKRGIRMMHGGFSSLLT